MQLTIAYTRFQTRIIKYFKYKNLAADRRNSYISKFQNALPSQSLNEINKKIRTTTLQKKIAEVNGLFYSKKILF